MNQTLLALIVGLVAGVGGAFTVHMLQGSDTGGGDSAVDWQPIQDRLAGIERQLQAQASPPGSLATRAGGAPAGGAATGGSGRILNSAGDDVMEALLAKIDERVGKTVAEKLAEARAEEDDSPRRGRRRRGRKRVSLADAARELELSAQQEDELRQIFENTQSRFFKLMAGPDGDPEEVKREVMEAAKTPGGAARLMPKYMPKVMGNIGELMTIQADREAAVQKTLGPEKAKQFNNDFSVKEDDILGLRGGNMSFEMEAGSDGN